MNAHRINAGKLPDISNGRNADFFFMDMEKEAAGKGMDAEDTAVIAQLTAESASHNVTIKWLTWNRK